MLEQGFCGDYVPVVVDSSVSSRRGSFEEHPGVLDETWRSLRMSLEFAFELVRSRPAVVHLNSSISPRGMLRDLVMAALARALRRPVVVQYHGRFPSGPKVQPVVRALVRIASANLVLSRSFVKDLEHCGGGAADRVLPNFIDDELLARPRVDRSAHLGTLRVLYVGSVIPAKGSAELLEIARLLPQFRFTALGLLPAGSRLDPPQNLSLEGTRSREQVFAALDSADVLLFPSHSEGFPFAVLEAMAARLPVVASNAGAIPDMIDHGRGGFVLRPGDVRGFAEALIALSADPVLRAQMGEHNRGRVEADYTHARVMERLARLYDELRATSA